MLYIIIAYTTTTKMIFFLLMRPESSSTQRISCSVYADKKVHSQEMRRSPRPADINSKSSNQLTSWISAVDILWQYDDVPLSVLVVLSSPRSVQPHTSQFKS